VVPARRGRRQPWGAGGAAGRAGTSSGRPDQAWRYIHTIATSTSINGGCGVPIPEGEPRDVCVEIYVENLTYIADAAGRPRACKFLLEAGRPPPIKRTGQCRPWRRPVRFVTAVEQAQCGNWSMTPFYHMRYEETVTLSDVMDEFCSAGSFMCRSAIPPGRPREPGKGELDPALDCAFVRWEKGYQARHAWSWIHLMEQLDEACLWMMILAIAWIRQPLVVWQATLVLVGSDDILARKCNLRWR